LVTAAHQAPLGAKSSRKSESVTPDGVLFCFGLGFYKDAAPTALDAFLDALTKCPVEVV
jgi:hypothetical protein